MFQPVVQHVTPLAEGSEVCVLVVRRVVIAMGGCQNHLGQAQALSDPRWSGNGTENLSSSAAPRACGRIPPATITQMVDTLPVRPPTPFACTSSPTEPDHGGQLGPIDRVKEAVLAPDRHPFTPSQ